MELTKRKQAILSSIVNSYIYTGEPVGSKRIAEEIGISSATVRNEMADLTELGLLKQPHTSSGRMPSHDGYRRYVGWLPRDLSLSGESVKYIDAYLAQEAYDSARLLRQSRYALAEVTHNMAAVSTPNQQEVLVQAVQFVQIGRRNAMLVLILSSGSVNSRVFHCEFDLTNEIMAMLFRAFNQKVRGKRVADISIPFIQTMGASLGEVSILASAAFVALYEAAQEATTQEVQTAGITNLLFYSDFSQPELYQIVKVLEQRELLLSLLGKWKRAGRMVLVGEECGKRELSNCSVVLAKYHIGSEVTGEIAAVGPVRMDYRKTIAAVRYIADAISELLTSRMNEEQGERQG